MDLFFQHLRVKVHSASMLWLLRHNTQNGLRSCSDGGHVHACRGKPCVNDHAHVKCCATILAHAWSFASSCRMSKSMPAHMSMVMLMSNASPQYLRTHGLLHLHAGCRNPCLHISQFSCSCQMVRHNTCCSAVVHAHAWCRSLWCIDVSGHTKSLRENTHTRATKACEQHIGSW